MDITDPFTGTPEEKQAVFDRIRERVGAIVETDTDASQNPTTSQKQAANTVAEAGTLRVGDVGDIFVFI